MIEFHHPPTPPAIPVDAVLHVGPGDVPVRRVEHTLAAYYEDVPGARELAEEGALAELLTGIRERYGPAVARVWVPHTAVHRPPAWPGGMARVWVTVELPDYASAQ